MSRWSPQPAPDEPDGLILFDGVCVFCSRWVRFVLRLDRERRFRFLPIQSERGRTLAVRHGINPDAPETNAVVSGGRMFFKSDAALVVLGRLPATAPLAALRIALREGSRPAAPDKTPPRRRSGTRGRPAARSTRNVGNRPRPR